MAERLIQLAVSEAPSEGGRVFTYTLAFDGHFVATNRTLTVEQSEQVREISETYETLFVNRTPQFAQLALGQIQVIGTTLFDLWLKADWQSITTLPGERLILVIASALPAVLNLPWELLRPPEASDIGSATRWGVRRLPWADRIPSPGAALLPGPLRVLFFACSPRDLPELDFEREEELLMTAVGPNAVIETASLGTFEELGDLVDSFNPHIVHLSGHGTVGEQGASFFFENEKGSRDPRSATKLGQRFSGTSVRCVFVSGCKAGSAPPRNALGGVCQSIISQGVPMAIGWGASIIDEIATTIAEKFYQLVAGGAAVDYALARARWEGKENHGNSGDPSWSLPVLYAATADTRILDKNADPKKPSPSREQLPLAGMTDGYARHLVGRRRELQALIPGLRSGVIRGVVLTGLGGIGTSSLATRLARKLESGSARLRPIAISCKADQPLQAEAVLKACRTAFLTSDRPDAAARTDDDHVELADRLNVLVNDLSDGYVLVLNNFESNLDRTRKIADSTIADFYRNLMTNLIGTSRVLVTSRHLPADPDPLPDDIVELTLAEFSEPAYLKFMFREAHVQRRYQAGAAERHILSRLYWRFGAVPSLVGSIRSALGVIDPAQLRDQIEQSARTPDQPLQSPLSTLEDKYSKFCADISLGLTYGQLPDRSKQILACLSVFRDPFGVADATALTGAGPSEIESVLIECHRSVLMHPGGVLANPNTGTSWSTYGSLRRWLTLPPRLSIEDGRSAHQAAGNYLVKLFDDAEKNGSPISSLSRLIDARRHFLTAGDAEKARKATYRICMILIEPGEYDEVERLNLELLNQVEASGQKAHPDPATWIARAYLERAEYETAREWYQKALTLAGDQYQLEKAHAIQGLATICIRKGQNDEARKQLDAALQIQVAISDRNGQSVTWHQLASIDFDEGNYDDARANFQKALDLIESPGYVQAIWHQLGSIDLEQRKFDDAAKRFTSAREMALKVGNRKAEADAIHQLGRTRFYAGARQAGLDLLRDALTIRRGMNDRAGEALSFRRLSEVAGDAKDYETAVRLAMVAYAIDSVIQGSTTRDMAEVERWSASLKPSPQQIESMQADAKEHYLRDRGKTLLKRVRTRP